MSDENQNPFEQASAFQKIWTESLTKMAQASMTFSPDSAPPEMMREIRKGIFKALTQSWDEFLRSKEFLTTTRQMMKNAVAFKQMNKEMLNRFQHELQNTNRNDIDTLMLNIRHLESRVLDHLENISDRLEALEARNNGSSSAPTKGARKRTATKSAGGSRTKTKIAASKRKKQS